MKIVKQSVELLDITPNSAALIERAGRTAYKSEDKITETSAAKFVAMLSKRGHLSVIEHAHASFRIVTDRGITHEIVRHRIASYSQESTRYCNYGKDKFNKEIKVVMPYGIHEGHPNNGYNDWVTAMEASETAYFTLLASGHKPQIARSVLPTCLKTEIVMTANFREWCHFLRLRMASAAHPQIRIIAGLIWVELVARCPPVFEEFTELAATIRTP